MKAILGKNWQTPKEQDDDRNTKKSSEKPRLATKATNKSDKAHTITCQLIGTEQVHEAALEHVQVFSDLNY